MKTRALGTSGLNVTEICLGTMTWGTQNTPEEAFAQMDLALEMGVSFWDTAELYPTNPVTKETMGNTESIIGDYFAANPAARHKVVLASKIMGPGRYALRAEPNITPATLRQAAEGSLGRLNTDHIDLYQLHWPNRGNYHWSAQWNFAGPGSIVPTQNTRQIEDDMLATLNTLAVLKKEGKIRHWGLSNESAWGTAKFLELARTHNLPAPVSIQNEYNLTCRVFEPDLAEVALRDRVGLLAWSPLAGGLLSGKYYKGDTSQGGRATLPGYSGQARSTAQGRAATDAYTDLARAHGLNPAQMAIAFTLAQPFTTASIIGATTLEQLKTDIEAANIKLSKEVMDGIEKIRRDYPMPY